MKFPTSLNRWPALAAAGMCFAAGCASPAPPMPPSLQLPRLVTDLAAQRLGDAVALHWTTPSRTTDDLAIKGALTAEICREVRPASRPSACVPVQRITVSPGATQAMDTLPSALTLDPVALLVYRVRLFNSNGRTAGPSQAAFAIGGASPPPVEQLRAVSTRSGVLLQWKPGPPSSIDLDRVLIAKPAPAPAPTKTVEQAAAPASRRHANLTPAEPAEIHLQTGDSASADSGGTLDRNARTGMTYRYAAQRVRRVQLAGHTLELRSDPSASVTITLADTFPPDTPTGLAAIPGLHSIDLSWEPVSGNDLAGYLVYRQVAERTGTPSGPSQRLTASPVTGPAYSDRTAVPGLSYSYRVTAIDAAGNESAPSAPVEQALPNP